VLCSILKNIIIRPKDEKFRKIMLSNAKLKKVLDSPGALFILEQAGFKKDEKLNCIQMPMDADVLKVKAIYDKIVETQEEEGKPVYFYSEEDPKYGCFSNFSPHGFVIDSKRYPTVEHCMMLLFTWLLIHSDFQSQKFVDINYAEAIRLTKSPDEARQAGENTNMSLRSVSFVSINLHLKGLGKGKR
jgi:hypothetical protein